jgi:uncharacterized protein (TIGR03067 family)
MRFVTGNPPMAAIAATLSLVFPLCVARSEAFVPQSVSLEEIQGRWDLISSTSRGKQLGFKGTLEIKGNLCTRTRISRLLSQRISLDTTRVSATMDVVAAEGTKKGSESYRIFEVSFTRLVMCELIYPRKESADRPKTLDSTPGSGTYRREWERCGPAPPKGSSISQLLEGDWVEAKDIFDGTEQELPFKSVQTWRIRGDTIEGECKIVDEFKVSLHKSSARADFVRASDQVLLRSLVEFDPESQELKIVWGGHMSEIYPSDFQSTADNLAEVNVCKKHVPALR